MSRRRLMSLSLTVVLLGGAAVVQPPAEAAPGAAAAGPGSSSVPVQPAKPGRVPVSSLSSVAPRTVAWPAAGSAMLAVDRSGTGALRSVPAGASRVGGLPVGVRAGDLAEEPRSARDLDRRLQTVPARVRVSVAGRDVSQAAGVDGVILSLARADGTTGRGRVAVDIDYSQFRYASGGDFGPRLRLAVLPACVLSTPVRPACQTRTLLPGGVNNPVSATVSAGSVEVSAEPLVLAVTAGSSSQGGDWAASPLPATGSWAAGTQSGDFTYQIPLRVPPVPAGPTPQVVLSYSAQSVDGRTVSKNNQTSWIGEGWDLNLGYMERQYQSCRDAGKGTDDLCFLSYNLTMSLGGKTVQVIPDQTSGIWRVADDSGWRVERLLGATNGDNNGEYWRVTDLQGTQYYFGVGNRNGIDQFDVSQAVWRAPVWSVANWQDGCYNGTFRWSRCLNQAWRWNLDFVVDAHGNTMSLFYQREQIHYGAHNNAERVTMDRGGY
ncbi:MAG TPA: hypothetical protein VFR67_23295, partial [Pilimelia sp.]|nr:hypothetical protein [Pilimelia sp.]